MPLCPRRRPLHRHALPRRAPRGGPRAALRPRRRPRRHRRNRVTLLSVVPTMLQALLERDAAPAPSPAFARSLSAARPPPTRSSKRARGAASPRSPRTGSPRLVRRSTVQRRAHSVSGGEGVGASARRGGDRHRRRRRHGGSGRRGGADPGARADAHGWLLPRSRGPGGRRARWPRRVARHRRSRRARRARRAPRPRAPERFHRHWRRERLSRPRSSSASKRSRACGERSSSVCPTRAGARSSPRRWRSRRGGARRPRGARGRVARPAQEAAAAAAGGGAAAHVVGEAGVGPALRRGSGSAVAVRGAALTRPEGRLTRVAGSAARAHPAGRALLALHAGPIGRVIGGTVWVHGVARGLAGGVRAAAHRDVALIDREAVRVRVARLFLGGARAAQSRRTCKTRSPWSWPSTASPRRSCCRPRLRVRWRGSSSRLRKRR